MSFQAYLDNIQAKTGKSPEDFIKLAREKELLGPGVKAGEIVAWLKEDFGLGHGHAMAIVNVFKQATLPTESSEEKLDKHFSGAKAGWHGPYAALISELNKFGPDVQASPTGTYINLQRGSKKFGIVQVSSDRMDVGIKLKGAEPNGRFEAAGNWNAMVTHRVRVTDLDQVDAEMISWLKQAYEKQ